MIAFDDDPRRIEWARVHAWLRASYWSPGISRELVQRAAQGSHVLGAYRDDVQIGYARAVTDHATFAWIADVWVDEIARGQGIGRAMVRWFLDHPHFAGIRRFALVTGDAHGVYAALGFHSPLRPERYMERLSADFAARLAAAS